MSATLERPTRLPAEHLGQARLLRQRLRDAELLAHPVVEGIWKQVRTSRQTQTRVLGDAASAWQRDMPSCGCVARSVDVGKHYLEVEELRAGGEALFWYRDWKDADRELSIALVRILLSVHRKRSSIGARKVAHISLHALARWHERAIDHTDAAFYASCRVMAEQHPGIIATAQSANFSIAVADGRWLGNVTRVMNDDAPADPFILAVRTFIAA
jgi:hypothetical protein